jgi:hypothetical protein
MLLQIVCVKDSAVNSFTNPVCVPHVGGAIREFSSSANNIEHDFYKHSIDYDLYHLGTFDNDLGLFVTFDAPIRLIRGVDAKVV